MTSETRPCPNCGTQMTFRLGEFECQACGHIEPAKPPEAKPQASGPGFAGQQKYGGQPSQAPPPTQFSVLRSAGRTEPSDTGRLGREKTLFLTIYFVFQLASSFLFVSQYEGAAEGVVSLPGLLFGAVLSTLGIGFVLYFDMELIRQCCMWSLAPIVVLAGWSVIMAFATGQGSLTLSLIPTILFSIWLFSILVRDRRSE